MALLQCEGPSAVDLFTSYQTARKTRVRRHQLCPRSAPRGGSLRSARISYPLIPRDEDQRPVPLCEDLGPALPLRPLQRRPEPQGLDAMCLNDIDPEQVGWGNWIRAST